MYDGQDQSVQKYEKSCEIKYNKLLEQKSKEHIKRYSIDDINSHVENLCEALFGIKFDKFGNYNPKRYATMFERSSMTTKDHIIDEF